MLIFTLYDYSKEGDIGILTRNVPSAWKMRKMYPTKNDITKRMHDLIIYKAYRVKWNKCIIIAIAISFILLYYFRGSVNVPELTLLTGLIFLGIDLPNRWVTSHISKSLSQEGTMLYTLFSATPATAT